MTREVKLQPNRKMHLQKLDPYGDGDCLLHAINFNVVAKSVADSLDPETAQRILESGYIRELKAAARAHGINIRLPKAAKTLREQLFWIFLAITKDAAAQPKNEHALMQSVHWGVWQKISGMALRRIANRALVQKPELIEQSLYQEFLLALSQRILQVRYPQVKFPISTDRFDTLFNTEACQYLIEAYLNRYCELFPEDGEDSLQAQTAIAPLMSLVDQPVSQCDPDLQQVIQETWHNALFPQWIDTFANNQHLNHGMLGDEHSKALSELWQINLLQINQKPQQQQVNLTPLNFNRIDPTRDYFIVQRNGAHYIAGIELGDEVIDTFLQSVQEDKAHYAAAAGQVDSRFGRWNDAGFIPKKTVISNPAATSASLSTATPISAAKTLSAPASAAASPIVNFVDDEQTQTLFRLAIAQELVQRAASPTATTTATVAPGSAATSAAVVDVAVDPAAAENSPMQLQLALDAALAEYIQEHQVDDDVAIEQSVTSHSGVDAKGALQSADLQLERAFYQQLSTAKEPKYANLYHRFGLLSQQLHSKSLMVPEVDTELKPSGTPDLKP